MDFTSDLDGLPRFSATEVRRYERPMTAFEMWEAMTNYTSGKSPGLDGLRYELYAYMPDLFEILRRNSKSAESRFRALLQDENLDDKTPSEFLRRIRELSDDTPADSVFVKKLYFSCLPTNVQTILANMVDTNTIDQIAASADKIMEFSHRPTIADSIIASSSSRQQPDNTNGDTMLKAIDGLTRQITQFCLVSRRSRSRSLSFKRRNTFSTSNFSVCWYRAHFHDKARHCNKYCAFKVSEN
ncbi:uncharacterized protein LOC128247918 [Octopus bimaculoides]|uniref:uncharacterized protein LOC128247918 n=1 Tax=Octopus bimaculoides TaxID=37653 RepID=UPI0022E5F275|nr:uncharacterized protein LOC128247918 [Octopus bimaculoides]